MKGLAIDPGTHDIGFAFFDLEQERLTLREFGRFRAPNKPLEIRLHRIFQQVGAWLDSERLDVLVTERSMSNRNYPGGGETVREALGVIKVAAVSHGLDVVSLRPSDAKWAVAGKIAASKLEVAESLHRMGIALPHPPEMLIKKKLDHISDAIALAIAFGFLQSIFIQLYDMKGELLCGLSKPEPKKRTTNSKGSRRGNSKRQPTDSRTERSPTDNPIPDSPTPGERKKSGKAKAKALA